MKKMCKIDTFNSFKISKQAMNSISGSRTKSFSKATMNYGSEDQIDTCMKTIDDNEGNIIKQKIRERYEGMC